ncbi:hypothetical protein GUJ93_ZPchr0002g24818 [Zizania palustris]|uniref:Uncharacterized protein n=1 Tax=Zizania palustris TaxID=103762 RepID=A0A8J5S4K0_ZIZPA|nr:hypothetical protein GUJ93_ZPchr0002g24818 [Zizania palustris]
MEAWPPLVPRRRAVCGSHAASSRCNRRWRSMGRGRGGAAEGCDPVGGKLRKLEWLGGTAPTPSYQTAPHSPHPPAAW